MKFTPKSDQEIANMGLLNEGVYSFKVIEAKDQVSKAGNDMIKLTMHVYDNTGNQAKIDDYLLEQFAKKLKEFAYATGLEAAYDLGDLDSSDCLEKQGRIKIVIEQGKPKGDGTNYPNKNVIKAYLKPSMQDTESHADGFTNDDVPF